jgi:hypothetical protein
MAGLKAKLAPAAASAFVLLVTMASPAVKADEGLIRSLESSLAFHMAAGDSSKSVGYNAAFLYYVEATNHLKSRINEMSGKPIVSSAEQTIGGVDRFYRYYIPATGYPAYLCLAKNKDDLALTEYEVQSDGSVSAVYQGRPVTAATKMDEKSPATCMQNMKTYYRLQQEKE